MTDDIVDFTKSIIAHVSSNIRVCMPGKVESYDYKTQKATVKIDMKEAYSDGTDIDCPVVSEVPVVFMSSGGASITMPVKTGDTCLLVFADRDITRWLNGGNGQKPESLRSHNLTDAIAFVGLNPFTKASKAENNEDLLITYSGSNIRLKPNGIVIIESATEVTTTTKNLIINTSEAVTITAVGNVDITCSSANIVTTNDLTVQSADDVIIQAADAIQINSNTIKLVSDATTRFIATGDIRFECTNFDIDVTGNVTLDAVGKFAITAPTVTMSQDLQVTNYVTGKNGGTVTTRGISNTKGTIVTSGITLDTHKHTYINSAGVPTPTTGPI